MEQILMLLTDLKAVSLKDLSDLPEENQHNVDLCEELLQEGFNQVLLHIEELLQ